MHISMFHGLPDDYVQITCHQERYQERLLGMGWRKTPDELPGDSSDGSSQDTIAALKEQINHLFEENAKLKIAMAPASAESHAAHVAGLIDKDEVESYIKHHFGVDIDKRGSLETVKDKALAVINESGRSGS